MAKLFSISHMNKTFYINPENVVCIEQEIHDDDSVSLMIHHTGGMVMLGFNSSKGADAFMTKFIDSCSIKVVE